MKNAKQLIEDAIKYINGEIEFPTKEDYDLEDESVKMFFDIMDNKELRHAIVEFAREDPEVACDFIEAMQDILHTNSLTVLRYVFQNLMKASGTQDEAIDAEDLESEVEDLHPIRHRVEAGLALEKYKEMHPEESGVINDVLKLILRGNEGDIRSAASIVRSIYANKCPSQNIRLAYTTLNTQDGEPYQMCPKAAKQIGYPIPMELSKCRDNCIDSRKTPDGKVTCAYQDWLRVVADNQESVLARLAASRFNDNEGLPLLNDITRPGPSAVEKSREQRMQESEQFKTQQTYYKRDDLLQNSIERSLMQRNLNNKQAQNNKRIVTANTELKVGAPKNMKKFNLAEHINAISINDKLDEYREFFDDTLTSESASSMNKHTNNNKYEKATSMESLLEEARGGVPDEVMNEQLEKVRKGDIPRHTTPINTALEEARHTDPMDMFLQTIEEKLEAKRKNANK